MTCSAWLPCPNCAYDDTYHARPSGPRPCKRCRKYHAVVRTAEGLRVIPARPGRSYPTTRKITPRKPQGGRRRGRRNTERRINGRAVKWKTQG